MYKWFVCIYIYITQQYWNILGYPLWFVAHFPPFFVSIIAGPSQIHDFAKRNRLDAQAAVKLAEARAGGTSQDFTIWLCQNSY